jgi:hypothetical protein
MHHNFCPAQFLHVATLSDGSSVARSIVQLSETRRSWRISIFSYLFYALDRNGSTSNLIESGRKRNRNSSTVHVSSSAYISYKTTRTKLQWIWRTNHLAWSLYLGSLESSIPGERTSCKRSHFLWIKRVSHSRIHKRCWNTGIEKCRWKTEGRRIKTPAI